MLNKTFKYRRYKNYEEFLLNRNGVLIEDLNPHYWYSYRLENLSDTYNELFEKEFFRGTRVVLPSFREFVFDSYRIDSNFERYTSKEEVRNIALWSLGCLASFDNVDSINLGKEVEILQDFNPRDGRLDVCAKTDEAVLIIETMTGLRTMLNESRFDIQMVNYKLEIDRVSNKNGMRSLLLLEIGGKETDLYPLSHPDCFTNDVGLITTNFYRAMISKNIKFISPNALWGLYLLNMSWEETLFDIFEKKDVLGLLSAGVVINTKNGITVESLF